MKYVMVLLVPFYKVDDNTIACESAFAIHLKELLPRISQWGSEIVIHSPQMSAEDYEKNKHHLAHIDCEKEHIHYVESYPVTLSRIGFLIKAPFTIWPAIWRVVKTSNVVHASVSKDILRAFTIIALIFAVILRKKTIVAMDIDHRNSAKMSYLTGKFSRKSYWLSQYVYNPMISLQLRFVSKYCDLVMLKGQALVDDYGKGRAHVKNFYDTAHDASFVMNEAELNKKLACVDSNNDSIRLVYFGRLVAYKGINDMIRATKKVAEHLQKSGMNKSGMNKNRMNKKVTLDIVGAGECEIELKNLVDELELQDTVNFVGALSYGSELFDYLKSYDFLLAAPYSEDTPRSVFDAMACGLPMIAYDTYYYKDLENTGTVKTVPWLSTDAMADKIIELSNDPDTVKTMVVKGVEFATNNTQKVWLDKRLAWTEEFLS